MVSFIAGTAFMLTVVGVLVGWAVREDRRLRRVGDRYRELEFEGIEELEKQDPYPEFEGREPIVEPDGTKVDAAPVLHEELQNIRRHMTRQSDRDGRDKRNVSHH